MKHLPMSVQSPAALVMVRGMGGDDGGGDVGFDGVFLGAARHARVKGRIEDRDVR